MTSNERAHIERLLVIHRASLRDLEVQAATFGDLHVPVHVKHQIDEHQGKIAELEARMAELLPLHNLPPRDYERFVGRQAELAELRRLLSPRSRAFVVTIDGIGGIGKSALALEAAYACCESYTSQNAAERFDAMVWVSAKRSYLTADGILERRQAFRTLDDLYAEIAQVLDFPAITRARAEEQRAIVEQVLGEQRTLLILDNLETVDDEDLMVFLRELPTPTKAIVTTRHRIDVAHPVRLTGMPHQDALDLIGQEALRKAVTLTVDEREQLWQRTGGMPLAIVWSIGLMGLGGSIESVLRRLGSSQSDIARFCFSESVAQIRGRDAYWLLLSLGLFATDASREALSVVSGLGEDMFGRDMGLEELLRLSLVNKSGDRFSLLPLTRSFVQGEALQQVEFSGQAHVRLYNYYDALTHDRGGWSKDWEGQALVERELPNLIAMIAKLEGSLKYDIAENEIRVLQQESYETARNLLKILRRVGRTCRIRGEWTTCEQLYHEAITIGRAVGDYADVLQRYWDLSRVSFLRGDLEMTEHFIDLALADQRILTDRGFIIRALSVRGRIALARGNLDEAEQLITKALVDYAAAGKDYARSDLLYNAGYLAYIRGDTAEAQRLYTESILAADQMGDLPRVAVGWLGYGLVTAQCGQVKEARRSYQESLATAQKCGRADTIAEASFRLAQLDLAAGNSENAVRNIRISLDLFRRLGMRKVQSEAEALLTQLGATP